MTSGSYLEPGTRFADRFEIGRELGRGGVSVVYAARDLHVGQDVALKLLVPSPAAANQARERMRREVHAVRQLVHANIVAVYDFVEDGPYGAVIMELVDGDDLDRRVRRVGPLSVEDTARVGAEVASALAAAHAHGILHRDVKPQNILIERDGRARLADFGSARMDGEATITRTGAVIGTLAYMAPEAVSGRRGDARSDVFSLGMTLFHAVAGRLPDRPSPHLPVPASASGYAPLGLGVDVPAWLARAISRATCADPADRFPSPAAFADALSKRDAGVTAGQATVSREQCALCGGLDILGTGVCLHCASDTMADDAFVFLERPRSAPERDLALDATVKLLRDDAPTATLAAVSSGAQALMRVPSRSAERVIELLWARGLRARVTRERDLWRALPPGLLLLSVAVAAAGIAAGIVGGPMFGGSAVPFAVLLLVGGTVSLRRPAIRRVLSPSAFSDVTRARVASSFAQLPAGTARELLADVARRAHAVRRALAMRQDASGIAGTVEELLDVACASALDLASLDESLTRFERERHHEGGARWLDSVREVERTRDSAVQRLLDAVTVLGQLDLQAIRGTDDVNARLGELVTELGGEVRARAAAREEMAALFGR